MGRATINVHDPDLSFSEHEYDGVQWVNIDTGPVVVTLFGLTAIDLLVALHDCENKTEDDD